MNPSDTDQTAIVKENRSGDLGKWIIAVAVSAIPSLILTTNEGLLGFLGVILLGIPVLVAVTAGKRLKAKYQNWGNPTFPKSKALWIYTRLVVIYGLGQYAAITGGMDMKIAVFQIVACLTILGGFAFGAFLLRPNKK